MGFTGSPIFFVVLMHPEWRVANIAHVDDILCRGKPVVLDNVRKRLEEKYDVKGRIMNNPDDDNKLLGRVVGRQSGGYYWKADPKHKNILLEEWGISECKAVATPIAKLCKEGPRK